MIGAAYINTNRCIAWADHRDCIVCEEMCPLPEKAITLDVAVTHGQMNFDSAHNYTLAGSNALTMKAARIHLHLRDYQRAVAAGKSEAELQQLQQQAAPLAPPGFSFADDNCALLNKELYSVPDQDYDEMGRHSDFVKVVIYNPLGKVLATLYTDEDGYYMLAYKHTSKSATYKVTVPTYNRVVSILVKANGFAPVDFEVP